MSKPILGYWNIRGYAQPIRFMLAYIGVDYENKLYHDCIEGKDSADWLADKYNLGLDFPNLPYWIEGDVRMTELKAILRYLAREKGAAKGLFPTDPTSTIQMDMVENVIFDARFFLSHVAYINTDMHIENLKTQAPLKFQVLSKFLGTKQFLIGDKPTYVDFLCYELLLYYYTAYDAEYLKPYPNLVEYKKRFEAIPEIAPHVKLNVFKGCTLPTAIAPIGY